MRKVYASKDLRRAIMVDDEEGIIKAYGLNNVLVCEAESLIETEELEETDKTDFEWTESVSEIYLIRSAAGLTQKEFAKKYNIPERSIQNWEAPIGSSNHRDCPEYVVQLLARVVKEDFEK